MHSLPAGKFAGESSFLIVIASTFPFPAPAVFAVHLDITPANPAWISPSYRRALNHGHGRLRRCELIPRKLPLASYAPVAAGSPAPPITIHNTFRSHPFPVLPPVPCIYEISSSSSPPLSLALSPPPSFVCTYALVACRKSRGTAQSSRLRFWLLISNGMESNLECSTR